MVSIMLIAATAVAVATPVATMEASEGWTQFVGGNDCHYKLVNEPKAWFHAVRHCHDYESGSELALIRSEAEAAFTGALGDIEGAPRWLYAYFDETKWNQDYAALNLWHQGQSAQSSTDTRHCAVQSGDGQGKKLLSPETCSKKMPFVCKICSSGEAFKQVVGGRASVELRDRARKSVSSTTSSPEPQNIDRDTETVVVEVAGVSEGIARSTASTGSGSLTLTTGAVAAIVMASVALLAMVVHRVRRARSAIVERNGEGFMDDELYSSSFSLAVEESETPFDGWDNTDLE